MIRARTKRWCPELVDFPERYNCITPKINRGNTVPTVVNVCRTQAKQTCIYAASAGSEVVVPLLSLSVNLAENRKPCAGGEEWYFQLLYGSKSVRVDRSVQFQNVLIQPLVIMWAHNSEFRPNSSNRFAGKLGN